MVLVATQDVKTAVLASSKISQKTQHATGVPSDTATSCLAPPVATPSHLDPTVGPEKFVSVTQVTFARVLVRTRLCVVLDSMLTELVRSLALIALPVSTLHQTEVLRARPAKKRCFN